MRAFLLSLAAFAALTGCNRTPSAPTDADVLAALRAAYAVAQLDTAAAEERDADGNLTAYAYGAAPETTATATFPSPPVAVALIECVAKENARATWICQAGVTFQDTSKAWGTWLIFHTPAGGWSAEAQPEKRT